MAVGVDVGMGMERRGDEGGKGAREVRREVESGGWRVSVGAVLWYC